MSALYLKSAAINSHLGGGGGKASSLNLSGWPTPNDTDTVVGEGASRCRKAAHHVLRLVSASRPSWLSGRASLIESQVHIICIHLNGSTSPV
jgi:hypothetical protein